MASDTGTLVEDTISIKSSSCGMTRISSKNAKNESVSLMKCPNERIVSLNLSGCLAKRWIKEKGSADDISFIEHLLDVFDKHKQEHLGCALDNESSFIGNLPEKPSPSPKFLMFDMQKSQLDAEEESVDVDIDDIEEQTHINVSDEEKWIDAALKHIGNDMDESRLESDQVEILVSKSEDTVCEICQQTVVGVTKRHHVLSKHFSLYIKCKQCAQEEFSNQIEMNLIDVNEYFSHQSTVHSNPSRECPFCIQFTEKNAFSQHLIHMHWKKLLCLCNTCGDNTDSTTSLCILKGISVGGHLLKKHSIPHTRKVMCDLCGVGVMHSNLAKHIKSVHEGGREICELCGKSFNDVKRHKKRVHIETPSKYQCTICDKKLTSKWNLTVHSRVHTGEKPFTCEVCGKSFRQKVELKLHLRNHHENPPKPKHNKIKTTSSSKPVKTGGNVVSKKAKNIPSVPMSLPCESVLQAVVSPSKSQAYSNVFTVIPPQPCPSALRSNNGNNDDKLPSITVIDMHNKDISSAQIVWISQTDSGEDITMETSS